MFCTDAMILIRPESIDQLGMVIDAPGPFPGAVSRVGRLTALLKRSVQLSRLPVMALRRDAAHGDDAGKQREHHAGPSCVGKEGACGQVQVR